MIKKNIRAIYISAWVVLIVQVSRYIEMVILQISYSYEFPFGDRILMTMVESVPYILPIMLLVLAIVACNLANDDHYKKNEVIFYIGFTLLFSSIVSILNLILGLSEIIAMIKVEAIMNRLNIPYVIYMTRSILTAIELLTGLVMVVIGLKVNGDEQISVNEA